MERGGIERCNNNGNPLLIKERVRGARVRSIYGEGPGVRTNRGRVARLVPSVAEGRGG